MTKNSLKTIVTTEVTLCALFGCMTAYIWYISVNHDPSTSLLTTLITGALLGIAIGIGLYQLYIWALDIDKSDKQYIPQN